MVITDAVSLGTKDSKLIEHPAEVKVNFASFLYTTSHSPSLFPSPRMATPISAPSDASDVN